MNEVVEFGIVEKEGVPVVSSRVIAEKFNKTHYNVIRAIDIISEGIIKNGDTPYSKYFFVSAYKNKQNDQNYQEILLNRDGFSLLVMGFTGEEALNWKLKYIKAFNEMENQLRSKEFARISGKVVRKELTDIIKELGLDKTMHGHGYSNYTNLSYIAVLGMTAKKYKETNGLSDDVNIRTCLNPYQIKTIEKAEKLIGTLAEVGYTYNEIKVILFERLVEKQKTNVKLA